MVQLHIKVVGEGSNIQLVRLDPDGKPTTARPGTPEELWMYGVLQRQFGVIEHLEDIQIKADDVIDRLTTELDWTRGVANTAEENLYAAQQEITKLKAEKGQDNG